MAREGVAAEGPGASKTDVLLDLGTLQLVGKIREALEDYDRAAKADDRVGSWNGILRALWCVEILEKRLHVRVVLGD